PGHEAEHQQRRQRQDRHLPDVIAQAAQIGERDPERGGEHQQRQQQVRARGQCRRRERQRQRRGEQGERRQRPRGGGQPAHSVRAHRARRGQRARRGRRARGRSPDPVSGHAAGLGFGVGRVLNMNYRTLGHTGTKVSPLCRGAMMFGGWGNQDHDDSIRIIHRALDAGVNFIDTADVYSRGGSEEIVGKALSGGKRDNVVLANKVHGTMGEDPNQFGNSRRWIIKEVENSLRRLGTDWIDLYQIHRPEADTEIDVLPTCQRYGMGVIPWSPLAGGWLSGRYRKDAELPQSHRAERIPGRYDMSIPGNQRKLEAADALAKLAEEAGITLIEMALAFVIRHPAVTAAIIGPRTMEHLESQLTAADVQLSDDVLNKIDEIVPPGVNLNEGDSGWQNPALEPAARRREGEPLGPRGLVVLGGDGEHLADRRS